MPTEVMMQRPHGVKRHATDDTERDQRLAKRFNLLNIENKGGQLYVPVTATSTPASAMRFGNRPSSNGPPSLHDDSDLMHVEDTKHRVFIHDLDEELAGAESDEEHPIFIADIEKHLLKLPRAVLMNDEEKQKVENMQMVLYKVPASLTVPKEQDNVRRIICEARKRIQDRQPFTIPDPPSETAQPAHTNMFGGDESFSNHDYSCNDEDAMDLG